MPFLVELRIPEFPGDTAALLEQLVSSGTYIDWDTPIALVEISGTTKRLVCNMPIVLEGWHAQIADLLEAGGLVALAQAEGDEIPYGKPMLRIE